jgi:hypothetical protein
METLAPDFLDDLFRFALLQTGDRQISIELLVEVAAEVAARASQWRTQRHRFLWASQLVIKRLEGLIGNRPAGADLETVLAEAMRDPRPKVRAALALNCLGRVSPSEALHAFRVRSKEMRVAQERFRERTASAGWTEAELQGRLKALRLNEEERLLISSAVEALAPRRAGAERRLGVAAVLNGTVVLLGWASWEHWRGTLPAQMQQFMGRLVEAHRNAGDSGLERYEGDSGSTGDWLFLHGIEGVHVPESIGSIALAAARVLDWNGGKVAQFPLASLPGIFMITDIDTLRISGEDAVSGRARFGEWSGAWMMAGPHVFMLFLRAPESTLEETLRDACPPRTDLPAFERMVRWFSGD